MSRDANRRVLWIVLLVFMLLISASLACSSGDETPTPEDDETTDGDLDSDKPEDSDDEEQATLTLINDLNETICYVLISPSTDDDWGDDWLDSDELLEPDDRRSFSLAPGTWDMAALDCSQEYLAEEYGVRISDETTWRLSESSGASTGDGAVTLVLENETDTEICWVYISPTTSDTWGDDWLGADIIPAHSDYTFHPEAGSYDMKAEDCSGEPLDLQWDVELDGEHIWQLTGSTGGGTTPGEDGGLASLTLVNDTSEDVCYTYISPTTSDTWGDDWLGADIIPAHSEYTFWMNPGDYDLMATDCSGDELALEWDVALSGSMTWTLSGTVEDGSSPGGDSGGTSPGGGDTGGSVPLTIANDTGTDICYVYISLSTSDSWGGDWLGADILPAHTTYTFWVDPGTYDLLAEDCYDGTLANEWGVSITGGVTWTISGESGGTSPGGDGGGTGETVPLTVINWTPYEVCNMYISPSWASDWGGDWMDGYLIYPDSMYFFAVPPDTYDMMAVACDGQILKEEYGVDIYDSYDWEIEYAGPGGVGMEATLTVINQIGETICFAYFTRAGNPWDWSDDALGTDVIGPGDAYMFYLDTYSSWDLRVEDCYGVDYSEYFDIDVTSSPTMTLTGW